MRILFLSDNFPPEGNAPASRTYEHCKAWVERGAEVTVITGVPNYPKGEIFPGYKNKWRQEEMIDGIRVIRVWTYVSPNRGLFRRILDYLSFCFSAFFASLFIKTDIIVATSPQLFTALGGYLASFFKRKPWILEVRDLWPESIAAVGAMKESLLLKFIDQIVLFLYRNATQVVVVTDSFKSRIHNCGVPEERIHVVKNGVDLKKFQATEKNQSIVNQLNLADKFVVAYIGTHGMAHNLDFILDCAQKVKQPDIHFLFVGDGAMKSRLVKKTIELQLKNVTMLDAVLKPEVAKHISVADVALIPLKKRKTFEKVLPSKIFESSAMRKPILLGVLGEAKELVESYPVGLAFEPESEQDFLQKLDSIYNNKEQYKLFQEGCVRLANDFDRHTLAMKMYKVIEKTVEARTRAKEVALDSFGNRIQRK